MAVSYPLCQHTDHAACYQGYSVNSRGKCWFLLKCLPLFDQMPSDAKSWDLLCLINPTIKDSIEYFASNKIIKGVAQHRISSKLISRWQIKKIILGVPHWVTVWPENMSVTLSCEPYIHAHALLPRDRYPSLSLQDKHMQTHARILIARHPRGNVLSLC